MIKLIADFYPSYKIFAGVTVRKKIYNRVINFLTPLSRSEKKNNSAVTALIFFSDRDSSRSGLRLALVYKNLIFNKILISDRDDTTVAVTVRKNNC